MKPSNCFVTEKDGEPDFVKLVDFGISKVRTDDPEGRSANLTRTNSALGTPLYMSPEQARSPRDVDHRTDLYSVGAILYEMLSGRTPYTADTGEYTEILFKIFTAEPEPLRAVRPDLPDALCAVVHRALMKDPNARFSSAPEMAEALAPFGDERSAQILARLRGGRGSRLPSMRPSHPAAPMAPQPVTAQSFSRTGGEAGRQGRVPTDVGVTREAGTGSAAPTASKSGRGALVLVGVVLVGLACAAAGVVVVRGRSTSAATTTPTTTSEIVPVSPATTTVPAASTALAPLPSAAPLPSTTASASASASASGAPPHPTGSPTALPQTLGGLKLH
jgi:serine/threonine-protein kinase